MGLSQCIHKGFSLVLDFSGQAARFGVRENDKLVTINGKTPRNVDDAVGVIKQAGNNIKLVKHNISFILPVLFLNMSFHLQKNV